MTIALLFWLIMVMWLIFGMWRDWPGGPKAFGGHIMIFILLALLGWQVFGAAIHK